MPDFWEVIKNRHCTREFNKTKEVTGQQVEKLLQAAKMAPSAGNMQDWEFKIIKDKKIKERLAQAALGQSFVTQAPVVIVVCTNLTIAQQHYGQRGMELYSIQDTAAATQNLLLAATALNLGACWVGAFSEDKVREILGLDEDLRPVAIIPVGYPK